MDFSGCSRAELNAVDATGHTPLHKTCLIGDWSTAGELILAGADPFVQDGQGRDAGWYAQLHFKASRALAARELAKGGLLVAERPDLEMSDDRARQLGKTIYEATVVAAGGRIADPEG